jgi:UDP-N-acetylglucosamine 1-carboxyvinyltransferase
MNGSPSGWIDVEGGRALEGQILLSGAKNAALPILAASLLVDGPVELFNVPTLMSDVFHMIGLLRFLGATIDVEGSHVRVDSRTLRTADLPDDLAGKIRASVLLMGPLLSRFGRASVPSPGGCTIGERPIDLHLDAVRRFGGSVSCEGESSTAVLPARPKAADISFPLRTTGGTENALSLAVKARGRSLLLNAHVRPEIEDLCRFLNAAGARIKVLGCGAIQVDGVETLHGVTHTIVPGDDEALTFLIAAAVTGGEVEIVGASADRLEIPLAYLRGSGVRVLHDARSLYVLPSRTLTGLDVGTGPYPGINSDMQPFLVVFGTRATGPSKITDTRFASRFQYVEQLARLQASIRVDQSTAYIDGPQSLRGSDVCALDLRAGAALVIAALTASGRTRVLNPSQIDRGYEAFEQKLTQLGAKAERVAEAK